jgi:hypothetical protein
MPTPKSFGSDASILFRSDKFRIQAERNFISHPVVYVRVADDVGMTRLSMDDLLDGDLHKLDDDTYFIEVL